MDIEVFKYYPIKPLKWLGITHPFFDINLDIVLYTWFAMAALFIVVAFGHFYFKRQKINPFSYALESVIEFFVTLCKDSFGHFKYNYFSFIMSLFTFVLFCNSVGMFRFVEEPSGEINTALACGISSFLYVHYQKINAHGIWEYIKEYFQPIFILFPLNIIGEFAKIISMSFRLFGNILGGATIVAIFFKILLQPYRTHIIVYSAIGLLFILLCKKFIDLSRHRRLNQLVTFSYIFISVPAWMVLFFGPIEGVIQAFVITMLTITYLSLIGKSEEKPKPNTGEVAC